MRKFPMILAGLLVLVCLIWLPPKPYSRVWWNQRQDRTPERIVSMELNRQLSAQGRLYSRIQWRDSVSSVLQSVSPGHTPFILETPEEMPDSLRSRLEFGIQRHLQDWEVDEPRLPLGVFFIDGDLGRHPLDHTSRASYGWQREFYVARNGEAPFCALVQPTRVRSQSLMGGSVTRLVYLPPSGSHQKADALRICGYYARFGAPGFEVEEWLREGASIFGSGVNPRIDLYRQALGGPLRGVFGSYASRYFYRNDAPGTIGGWACLFGVAQACRTIFLGGGQSREGSFFRTRRPWEGRSPTATDFVTNNYFYGDLGHLDQHFFHFLEEEFGADAFQQFWASEQPVSEAFQSAFGLLPEEWVMRKGQAIFGTPDRGPGVPMKASVISLLTVGLLGCLSLVTGRKQF